MSPLPLTETINETMPPFEKDDPVSKDIWLYQPFHDPKNTLHPSASIETMDDLFQNDTIDESMDGTTSISAFCEDIEVLPSPESMLSSTALCDNLTDQNQSTDREKIDRLLQSQERIVRRSTSRS